MPDVDLFTGCWMRFNRAYELMRSTSVIWNEHIEEHPYTPEFRLTSDIPPMGSGVLGLVEQAPIPEVVSLLFGGILYHLRACLDNAVYAAAIDDSGIDPPPFSDTLEFPILKYRKDFTKARRSKLASLSVKHQDLVERYQPFSEPAGAHRSPLYWLNELARIDRHRLMHVVAGYLAINENEIIAPNAQHVSVQPVPTGTMVRGGFTPIVHVKVVPYREGDLVRAHLRSSVGPDLVEWIRRDSSAAAERSEDRLQWIGGKVGSVLRELELSCTATTRNS